MEKRRHERARESFAVITDEEKACISVCVYIKASCAYVLWTKQAELFVNMFRFGSGSVCLLNE